jgi:hypothetical protein
MPAFVQPLRAFLDDVLGDDLRSLRVMAPAGQDDDAFYRDLHHYLRDDLADDYDDEDQGCIGREVLEERWTGEGMVDETEGDVEYAVYSYDDIEVVMVFEGTRRATAVTFASGAAGDIGSFADHVHDIVLKEASTRR